MGRVSRTLEGQLAAIARQLGEAVEQRRQDAQDKGIEPLQLMYVDGRYVLHELLVAKAQALAALAQLVAARK